MNKEGSIPDVKALLLVGALYAKEEYYLKAKERLAGMFGPIVMETAPRAWDYTDHYEEELGPDILRRFLFFENTVNQNELAEIKIKTNSLEEELSTGGKRNVNLDPGYMTMAKLVLASTKDYSHRICLGRGIFAEVALSYIKDGFKPYHYTYRDYRDEHCLKLFHEVREKFLKGLSSAP